ncbi:MAG: L-serine ammonia-lyase, iron-sulfur-dependent, subunit alpha [Calditrichia bacterium]
MSNPNQMNYPSIFNDVLGPVMRGPSSSHCAAALRIGRICLDLMDGKIESIEVRFDPHGSLATTHESQGSDMGLFGGLLGWEAHDERLTNYREEIVKAGIEVDIQIVPLDYDHPNTYALTLKNYRETRTLTAISTGGGMIEIVEIDGAAVSMAGDYYETLTYVKKPEHVQAWIEANIKCDAVELHRGNHTYIEIKGQAFPESNLLEELAAMEGVVCIRKIEPVLPVLSRKDLTVPFITCDEMLEYNSDKNLPLWQLGLHYESARGNISHEEAIEKMRYIVSIMRKAIDTGLKGTEFGDRILGSQSPGFRKKMEDKTLIHGDVLNRIISSVSAIMEVKSSMGVIVAAPTAGSCGAMPGAVLGAVEALNLSDEEAIRAMFTAGLIGVFVAAHATFAAEVGGCQAECGSGAGMSAAALVEMAGGGLSQSISAASMALQNSFGMVCDPIANRVEAPCLGKNVLAASNALSCANMALANYDHLIPLDEVIEAMDKVGKSIPNDLRCTALGGLSITKTSKEIEARLNAGEKIPIEIGMVGRFKSC